MKKWFTSSWRVERVLQREEDYVNNSRFRENRRGSFKDLLGRAVVKDSLIRVGEAKRKNSSSGVLHGRR